MRRFGRWLRFGAAMIVLLALLPVLAVLMTWEAFREEIE